MLPCCSRRWTARCRKRCRRAPPATLRFEHADPRSADARRRRPVRRGRRGAARAAGGHDGARRLRGFPLRARNNAAHRPTQTCAQASVKAQLLHSVTYPGDVSRCVCGAALAACEAAPLAAAERWRLLCSENAAASGVVTAVPVPEMPTPALLALDESNAALQAELAEAAKRVAVLREQVPNALRDCAVSLQKTLRAAASSVAASAAGTTLTALQAVAAPGSEAHSLSEKDAEDAAGALVPVEHALAMTADLSESVAALPAVADRLQARPRPATVPRCPACKPLKPSIDAAALALCSQEALARMQRVVAAVESRVAVQAPVAALEADAAAVLRGDGAWRTIPDACPTHFSDAPCARSPG